MKNVFIYLYFLFLTGCAVFNPSKYPETIYNNRTPMISISHEYGEISINAPLIYPGLKPEYLSIKVFSNGDTTSPLITFSQGPLDNLKIFLPQGVLNNDKENNFLLIEPNSDQFSVSLVPFKGKVFGKINLEPIYIVEEPLLLSGWVKNQMSDKYLANVDISIFSSETLVYKTFSDGNGQYSISIPGTFKKDDNLKVIAGLDLIFSPYRKNIKFKKNKKTLNIGLGPSPDLAELGNIYLINKPNSHFRDKPHIAGGTKFLLPEGQPIAVHNVSAGLYYGTIEIEISNGSNIQLEGWVSRQDTDLLFFDNLFKTESSNDKIL